MRCDPGCAIVFLALFLIRCGAAATSTTSTTQPENNSDETVSQSAAQLGAHRATSGGKKRGSAVAMVKMLTDIARGKKPGPLSLHIDHAFGKRLSSTPGMSEVLLRAVPEGCLVELSSGGGYEAVAIPPPLIGDTDEQTAETEDIIRILRASTEVHASCKVRESAGAWQDYRVGEEVSLFSIALMRGSDGHFRALAWRDFRRETKFHGLDNLGH